MMPLMDSCALRARKLALIKVSMGSGLGVECSGTCMIGRSAQGVSSLIRVSMGSGLGVECSGTCVIERSG